MDEHSQVVVPEAFVRLFVPPGRLRPTEAREVIAQRHEFCEDLAQALTETARRQLLELHITETDVLQRVAAGLMAEGSPVSAAEAPWVLGRLAELLDWPLPEGIAGESRNAPE